ncbi:MAG: phospholipid-binding protein MlaC [Syntrophales bacterium]
MKKKIACVVIILALNSAPAYAGAPLDMVRVNVDKVLAVLRDKQLGKEAKTERLETIYKSMFDEEELSRRALGRNWKKLNPAQQQEFVDLFRRLLEKAYIDKILDYTNEKVDFTKEIIISPDQAEVQTKVITSSRQVPIFYRVIMKGGAWKVYDVVIENVSLVQNYRSQFNSIMAKNTPAQLLDILRKRVKQK